MNVLSLFDGISCGQVALKRAGIKYNNYYASEIDKYAIEITQKNFPNTIQIGDVLKLDFVDYKNIDPLLGGSPCQGISGANPRGNGLRDKRSRLFYKYVEAIETARPLYFLFENVSSMKKEDRNTITKALKVNPIEINSSLLSAQNRNRLYWTNIPNIEQPQDRGILLKDILLANPHKELLHTDRAIEYMSRKVRDGRDHWDFKHYSDVKNDKSAAVVANFFKGVPYNVLVDNNCIRKFDTIECERLQTLPDNYTEGISNTQRYKAIGNGWTVDVIAHILSFLPA